MHSKMMFFHSAMIITVAGLGITDLKANTVPTSPSSPSTSAIQKNHPTPRSKDFRPAEIGNVIFVLNEPAILHHALPRLIFHNKTLSDVLNEFSTLTNTNVAVGWAAISQKGINTSRRLTLRLPPQGYKLDLVAVLAAFAPHVHMVITADQNVIFINTRTADNQHLIMRTYWLSDLVANIPRYINPYSMTAKKHKGPSDTSASKAKSSNTGDSAGRDDKPTVKDNKKNSLSQTNILQLITDHVEPTIWVNHGGKATISQVGDKVIVIAPASVQAILQGPSYHNPNAAPLFTTVSY